MSLVPGHRPGGGLVRIDRQPSGAIHREGRCHGDGVRTHRQTIPQNPSSMQIDFFIAGVSGTADRWLTLLFKQFLNRPIKAVEQQVSEHIAGDHVFTGDGKQICISLLWVQGGVIVDSINKSFYPGDGFWA